MSADAHPLPYGPSVRRLASDLAEAFDLTVFGMDRDRAHGTVVVRVAGPSAARELYRDRLVGIGLSVDQRGKGLLSIDATRPLEGRNRKPAPVADGGGTRGGSV